MAQQTVTNIVKTPDGTLVPDLVVTAILWPLFTVAFDPGGVEVASTKVVNGDAFGFWTMALERTDTMTPTGMTYQVTEISPSLQFTRVTYIALGAVTGDLESMAAQPLGAVTQSVITGPPGPRGASGGLAPIPAPFAGQSGPIVPSPVAGVDGTPAVIVPDAGFSVFVYVDPNAVVLDPTWSVVDGEVVGITMAFAFDDGDVGGLSLSAFGGFPALDGYLARTGHRLVSVSIAMRSSIDNSPTAIPWFAFSGIQG